ncbi:hypothetical protein FHS43_002883 [Streptosporangium becharense]|uniref:Gas vesicle protein n=1 Tax=Streptosporangium becharense TaxID=1816182 RepID=A0A7W9IKX4_9ACTN|nr:gas vesicle protein GvpO [Streptosporangium becharense]MBB2911610.1 hypothetical protein [Streptosporangium becharense]MBB5822572.1 hypothetical protein [Streptosporangium becharense]
MPVRRRVRDERAAGDAYETAGDDALDQDELDEEDEDEFDDELEEPEEDEEEPARAPRGAGRRSRRLSAATAGMAGLRHIAALTGKHTEGVTLVQPAEDGWLAEVEVVEDRHVPSTGDMLALYQVEMDPEGELLSYRRVRRYRRGRGDGGGTG